MSEKTVLRDGDGNYYAFAPEVLAAAQVTDGSYALEETAVTAARVPDDGVDAVESALGIDEVSGFTSDPIPGVDVIVTKHPPGHSASFTSFGVANVSYGAPGMAAPK